MLLDVNDHVAVSEAVQHAVDTFGGLDVVLNSAGYRAVGSVEDMPEDDFRRTIETNLFGCIHLALAENLIRPGGRRCARFKGSWWRSLGAALWRGC
jgi:NAD(P)-dependent dehydrogenase (short-subunit alcohol dehydrogenase family)